MSLIFALAAELNREMTVEYNAHVQYEIEVADKECTGYLVNRLGKAAGITGPELFKGSEGFAYKYASPELVSHWTVYGRTSRAAFEARWLAARGNESAIVDGNN